MTTINLRDGLEALYYFGEQDFNPQRNQLQDHSGYGRHATAQGGPTVGVNGQNDFGATSLDGADDYFSGPFVRIEAGNPLTISLLIKNRGDIRDIVSGGKNGAFWKIAHRSNFRFQNESFNKYGLGDAPDDGEWGFVHFVRDDSSVWYSYLNGELTDIQTSIPSQDIPFQVIGRNDLGSAYYNGEIALVGLHSRVLSDSEITHMSDLTAPLRAQL